MTDPAYDTLVANVIATLEKNGFPDKRVSLPLDRMYEVAYEKGLNFNKALTILEERGVAHEKTNDRIIFHSISAVVGTPATDNSNPFAAFAGMDPSQMDADQLQRIMAQAEKIMQSLPPDELTKIMKAFENLSPEEREATLAKAKGMGL